jgi:hypothetical protein
VRERERGEWFDSSRVMEIDGAFSRRVMHHDYLPTSPLHSNAIVRLHIIISTTNYHTGVQLNHDGL